MASNHEEELLEAKTSRQDEIEWVPFTATYVVYPKGDWLGKLFALISLTPIGIIIGFVALVLFRRDLHTIVFFIGALLNEALNFVLKNVIREARPVPRIVHEEYGMPSGHSQFSWFFATYVICFVCIRLHHMNNNSTLENMWKTVIVIGCLIFATVLTFSRVYLQYHSWKQVICGMVVGIAFGSLWFALTHFLFTPYFPVIVSWRLSELLLIRDTTLIPNVLWFEYTNTRQESRARSRKLVSMKSQ